MAKRKQTSIIGFARNTPGHGLSAVHYYRVVLPLSAIKANSRSLNVEVITQDQLENRINSLGSKITGDSVAGRDIMVLSRLYRREGLYEFIDTAHKEGTVVVFDTDDDLTDDFRELGRGDEFLETIKAMDYITVSTPFLADRMAEHVGQRPFVLYNHVDFRWFSGSSLRSPDPPPVLSIGLIGTASHEGDWIYPVKALKDIAEVHDDVNILVAGFMPEYLDGIPGIKKLKPVPYVMYPGMMRQFDIVCCSLDSEDDFNKSKSAIKAIEAMSAMRKLPDGKYGGAVPVCTDMPVYRRVVNHGHNGFLTDNDSWGDILNRLVEDKKLRMKVAAAGTKWVRKNRNIESGWSHWARLYKKIAKSGGRHVR